MCPVCGTRGNRSGMFPHPLRTLACGRHHIVYSAEDQHLCVLSKVKMMLVTIGNFTPSTVTPLAQGSPSCYFSFSIFALETAASASWKAPPDPASPPLAANYETASHSNPASALFPVNRGARFPFPKGKEALCPMPFCLFVDLVAGPLEHCLESPGTQVSSYLLQSPPDSDSCYTPQHKGSSSLSLTGIYLDAS